MKGGLGWDRRPCGGLVVQEMTESDWLVQELIGPLVVWEE